MVTRPHIPKYEKNVSLGVWEIDCLWLEHKVAVELDARDYHATIQDFDKDRKKDSELILRGIRPLRITEFVWEYDRASAIADLEAMLGLREPIFLERRAS
jgi:very-short-patch-repair endonuclease